MGIAELAEFLKNKHPVFLTVEYLEENLPINKRNIKRGLSLLRKRNEIQIRVIFKNTKNGRRLVYKYRYNMEVQNGKERKERARAKV